MFWLAVIVVIVVCVPYLVLIFMDATRAGRKPNLSPPYVASPPEPRPSDFFLVKQEQADPPLPPSHGRKKYEP